jgi:outer membrane lipoprotein SlyB
MRLASIALAALVLAGCVSQQTWSPVVDPYGDPRAEWIPHDDYECRELAMRASGFGPDEVIKGGLFGGFLGAATGAAIGAAVGNPGQGAAIGAASGGFGGGTIGGLDSNARFQHTFRRCMQGRGHNVIG